MLKTFRLSFALLAISGKILLGIGMQVDQDIRDMFNAMNRSVDPCDNFYDYMCGNWEAQNPIPSDSESWSENAKLERETANRVRDILKETDKSDDLEPIKLARKYYRSCMDEEALEARGLQPILEILERNGGWPILETNWTSANDTWQTIHANYLRLYHIGAFYHIKLNPDSATSSRVEIVINQNIDFPLLNFLSADQPADNFLWDYVKAVKNIIAEFAIESGINVTKKMRVESNELLIFQMSLQAIPQPVAADEYERITIKELQDFYDNGERPNASSHIDFLSEIKTIFAEVGNEINESTVVEVHDKLALRELKVVLESSSPRMIVNYIQWNLVANLLPYTNKRMRSLLFKILHTDYKGLQEKPRWKTCVEETRLERAISYEFVKRYTSASVIGKVSDMASKTRNEIKRRVLQSKNLKDAGKYFLTGKLNNLTLILGYPQSYSNENTIGHYYDELTVGQDYFENVLNYKLFVRRKTTRTFGTPFDKYNWFQSARTVNAFYNAQANSIVLPLARFRDYLVEDTPQDFLAYARVAFLLGHEISHAVTGLGLQYDAYGNKMSIPINAFTEEGRNNSLCFANEFSKYVVYQSDMANETIYVDGRLTKFENMADALGIQVAHDVYLSSKGKIHQNVTRPANLANYTDEQLFFMSFAASWCEARRPEMENIQVNYDIHAPSRYRIIGALSNSDAFARAFNCPLDSPMNPPRKCQTL